MVVEEHVEDVSDVSMVENNLVEENNWAIWGHEVARGAYGDLWLSLTIT